MVKRERLMLLRSVLYVPADNERALKKAQKLHADAYIFDLEDAISPLNKKAARETLRQTLENISLSPRKIIVRVNDVDSHHIRDDLLAIQNLPIDAILLPKVETRTCLYKAYSLFNQCLISANIPIWAMIETPKSLLNLRDILHAEERVSAIVMGTSDLSSSMQIPHTSDRLGFQYVLSHAVLVAKAYDRLVIDGVHLDLTDGESFLASVEQGVKLGFDGKSLIHPKQIRATNEGFSPSNEAVNKAHEIISAWDMMLKEKQGVCLIEGKLIEKLHVDEAKDLLKRHNAIEALAV